MWVGSFLFLIAAVALMAWAVRGRSARLLAPSVWRGPRTRRAIALTFDDGPSESTPLLLALLAQYRAKATFFVCGHHARRLPHVIRQAVREGHEIGNHTDTHEALYLRGASFILEQMARAQDSIERIAGLKPQLFRPTYGVRWFGMRAAQQKLGLTCVMWTAIARDWVLDGPGIAERLGKRTRPGSIFCLHDGRDLRHKPDIHATLQALELLLPRWSAAGYEFVTVSELLSKKMDDLAQE
jgi:peptidoglycan/xylan/chitin deacetylase (PgdA/CDA1 family)